MPRWATDRVPKKPKSLPIGVARTHKVMGHTRTNKGRGAKYNAKNPRPADVAVMTQDAAFGLREKAEDHNQACNYEPDGKPCDITKLLLTVANSVLRVRDEILREREAGINRV